MVRSHSVLRTLTFAIMVRSNFAAGTLAVRSQYAHSPIAILSRQGYATLTALPHKGEIFCACILVRLLVTVSCLNMTGSVDIPCSNAAQNIRIRQALDCPFSLNICAAVCGSSIIIPRVSSALCVRRFRCSVPSYLLDSVAP